MSYDISLLDPVTKSIICFDNDHIIFGGTYIKNGTNLAELNITYNYSKFYYSVLGEKGIRTIYGMSGAESIPVLKYAIEKLGNNVAENYWDVTEGNAKRALYGLLAFAQMRPDGIWEGD